MRYRPEIDGLRTFAVVPVILFHAGLEQFSGGYVGVDVFFVISGYLITSIIVTEKKAGKFSLLSFYTRRARRIFPALFLVMSVCVAFSWMWLLPHHMKDFAQSLVAASTFSSNIFFMFKSGYFDTEAELRPLLHTWSLAVEEQFYVLFPLLLVLSWRLTNRWIIIILCVVALGSLGVAQWGSVHERTATFYLLPTRGWELLLGSFVAFYLLDKTTIHGNSFLSILGIFMILYSIFYFDSQTPFPSIYTVVPTLGAVLIILFTSPATLPYKIFANRISIGIGLISYSAYLWHQPLFAFARHRSLLDPSAFVMILLSVLSFVLAYFSWFLVEKPLRVKYLLSSTMTFLLSFVFCMGALIFGLSGHFSNGFPQREKILNASLENIKMVSDVRCYRKLRKSPKQLRKGEFCTQGGKNVEFVVMGDSHAGVLFDEIEKAIAFSDVGFWAVSGGFCPPLLNFKLKDYGGGSCLEVTAEAFRQIAKNKQIKYVVLAAQWAAYTQGYRDKMAPSVAMFNGYVARDVSENPVLFRQALISTVAYLHSYGKRVIVMEPVPEFNVRVFEYLAKARLFKVEVEYPVIEFDEYKSRNRDVFFSFNDVEGVIRFPTGKLFCDEWRCYSVTRQGEMLYYDTNHLTQLGAWLIAKELKRMLFS